MNIHQKIVEVRKVADGFSKDKKAHNYNYVSGNQVLSKIKNKMNELQLLLIPSTYVGEHSTHEYKTAKGKDIIDFVVKGEMRYTWINGENPEEFLEIPWAYYGQQSDISMAYGSALTYSERYFLLKCLGLPTDEDDPDAKSEGRSTTQQPPNQPQTDTVTKDKKTQSDDCDSCGGKMASPAQIKFSQANFGRNLCTKCQKQSTQGKLPESEYPTDEELRGAK